MSFETAGSRLDFSFAVPFDEKRSKDNYQRITRVGKML